MARRRRIYEGKAKVLFEGPEPGTLVQYFKDDATAFNNKKQGTITGKGVINNRISEFLMTRISEIGIPTHFIRRLNMREQLVREVEIIPVEVVIRNVAAGSIAKRFGLEDGSALPRSIVEYYYKSDELDDPMISEEHITAFGWASAQEMDEIMHMSLRWDVKTNEIMDKDRFRRDLGGVEEAYQEVARRLGILLDSNSPGDMTGPSSLQ
jgi:phosphoribosylaminoimidazole-succinocarboxamide synthase